MNRRITFFIKNLYTMERLGIMQVSTFARLLGWETDLIIADDQNYGSILDRVEGFRPDILAFTAMSPEYGPLSGLARRLKKDFGGFVLFGGPHATFFQNIIEEPFMDAVAFGEADISFPEFLRKYETGEDYTSVQGMHVRRNGDIIRNSAAPLVESLDGLPFPDREIMWKGNSLMARNKSHLFMSSRGCPYACTYCFNHQYNRMFGSEGDLYRRRSVDNLVAEIEVVRDALGTQFAYIDDDIFTLASMQWLEEFAEKFPQRVGIPFMCNVHVNTVNEDKVRLLKQAGCGLICFGLECGDMEVSSTILKRWIKYEDIVKFGDLLHKYEIPFITQNLNALPVPHPLETDYKTLDVNIRIKPAYAVTHIFYPLPGSDLEKYARQEGYLPDSSEMPERTNSFSALRFPSDKEKTRVQRFQKLFGLVVSFPVLRPALPLLIRLPLGAVYSLAYIAWYGFTMRFQLEQTKKSRKEYFFFLKSVVRSFSSFLRKPPRKESYAERY